MNYRFLAQPLANACRHDGPLIKSKAHVFSRYLTHKAHPPLPVQTNPWAWKRYLLLVGVPLATIVTYRLTTKFETRRKHRVVLGSVGRAMR